MKQVLDIPGMVLSLDEIRSMDAKTMKANLELVNRSMQALRNSTPTTVLKIDCIADVKRLTREQVKANLPRCREVAAAGV